MTMDTLLAHIVFSIPVLLSGLIWFLLQRKQRSRLWLIATFRNMIGVLLGPTLVFLGMIDYLLFQGYDGVNMSYAVLAAGMLILVFVPPYAILSFFVRQKNLLTYLFTPIATGIAGFLIFDILFNEIRYMSDLIEGRTSMIILVATLPILFGFCGFIHWLVNRLAVRYETS